MLGIIGLVCRARPRSWQLFDEAWRVAGLIGRFSYGRAAVCVHGVLARHASRTRNDRACCVVDPTVAMGRAPSWPGHRVRRDPELWRRALCGPCYVHYVRPLCASDWEIAGDRYERYT